MRFAWLGIVVMYLVFGLVAEAGAPRISPRPQVRDPVVKTPDNGSLIGAGRVAVYYHADTRPRARTQHQSTKAPVVLGRNVTLQSSLATTVPVYNSPRPETRPLHLGRTEGVTRIKAAASKNQSRVAKLGTPAISRNGAVCGDRRIRGKALAPIKGTKRGCGLAQPVQITSINGIRLSQASTMDCTTAKTLAVWVTNSVTPSVGRRGGGLAGLQVAAHYSCRTRNSKKGAKISEHGKGHAIDISGLTLADGTKITVKKGWNVRRDHRLLAAIRAQACGPFGTVLGPGADRYHSDHFHLDTARYRGGPYCR